MSGKLFGNTPFQNAPNLVITGQICDTDNSPLDGVEISYNGDAIKTKSDGRFTWVLSDSKSSKIQLSFVKLGYLKQSLTINTRRLSEKPINLMLTRTADPLAVYTLSEVNVEPEVLAIMADKWGDEFKHVVYPKQYFDKIISLQPGDDIQSAIDSANMAGGGIVYLKEGIYILDSGLKLKSKVTLCGAGRDKTIIKQGLNIDDSLLSQGAKKLTDVVFKDLTFQGGEGVKASGLNLRGDNDDRHTRFMFQNVNVIDFGSHGIGISRINNVIMDNSQFQYNGTSGGLHHNVYFLYVSQVLQSDCDMSYPDKGKSNKYTATSHVLAQRCVMKQGHENGIQADHEQGGYLFFHKHLMSDFEKVAMWFPCEAYYDKFTYTEDPQYVPQNVILNHCEIVDNTWGAMWRIVGEKSFVINSHFDNEKIDMGLLKCDVKMENSTFEKGNEEYTDVKQWPEDVELLW